MILFGGARYLAVWSTLIMRPRHAWSHSGTAQCQIRGEAGSDHPRVKRAKGFTRAYIRGPDSRAPARANDWLLSNASYTSEMLVAIGERQDGRSPTAPSSTFVYRNEVEIRDFLVRFGSTNAKLDHLFPVALSDSYHARPTERDYHPVLRSLRRQNGCRLRKD